MDHPPIQDPLERNFRDDQAVLPRTTYSSFDPIPMSQLHSVNDLRQGKEDIAWPDTRRRGSFGVSSRAWPPTRGTTDAQSFQGLQELNPLHQHHLHQLHPPPPHLSPLPRPSSYNQSLLPPPPNGVTMTSPYDTARRRSLGAASSPPQYQGGPSEPPPPPPFPTRNMPPPSPPHNAPPHHIGSAPRGPPTMSPFPGVRDLSSHRPGMSISAILGGNEERKANGSPTRSAPALASVPRSMQPPSPARARSSSMRESSDRNIMNGPSPARMSIWNELARISSEPRKDEGSGSPPSRREVGHGFRTFQGPPQEHAYHINRHVAPVRPNSQPVESAGPRRVDEWNRHEGSFEAQPGMFRPFGEPLAQPQGDNPQRQEQLPYQDSMDPHAQDRPVHSSPQIDRDGRVFGPTQFQPGNFGPPLREEPPSAFRPTFLPISRPAPDMARESIEGAAHVMRRQLSQPSPPRSHVSVLDRNRNGYYDRPMTFEEHQRMDMLQREQHRKESDGSVHRAILNISPELNRKGRNSPLPQAVQGAQPRHIGPGGDNPGIKMEFGRMFSGLGSGVGSTPHPGHPVNGSTTPSRMSPARYLDNGDLVRSAVMEPDEKRLGSKSASRGGKRGARRPREDVESYDLDERYTPDLSRGNKRAKTTHTTHHHHHHVHPHHHHHHHHEGQENAATSHNMARFPSNPLPVVTTATNQAHHHHHHHAHPGHHHHHPPRPAPPPPRKPLVTVSSKKVIDEATNKPQKHLGSQLYSTELSLPPAGETKQGSKIKFSSKMKPIPVFAGNENCTFTVRVPRYFLMSSDAATGQHYSLEEICKRRQLWGTDIYTDDTDVVAAAIHSGWLKGDFGEFNAALREVGDLTMEQEGTEEAVSLTMAARPPRPIKVPENHDAHITVLILPPLDSYASTNQHHIWSREWNQSHDGMSFMIYKIEFVDEGGASRYTERGATARKQRIATEEAARREAAAGLLMFANGTGTGTVRVGA